MNRVLYILAFAVVAVSAVMLTSGNAAASTYTANFDADIEGWDTGGDGPYWGATGGQDGGYAGSQRTNAGGYLTPPTTSPLYGDLAANFGSNLLTASYYLKSVGGQPDASSGGKLYMFADTDSTPGWDTLWLWTPADTSVPTDWKQYTWSIDTTAAVAPADWSLASGTGSWADSWKNVKFWNFWTTAGTGSPVDNGIDTISVGPAGQVPEPTTISLLVTGLLGLLAYAWRKRK
jgi:hypothetical protein